MRIAFVGKGGSGKTTLATLFSLYAAKIAGNVLAVDADINMHMAAPLGLSAAAEAKPNLSNSANVPVIKGYLIGTNERIRHTDHFRKTTPPGRGSRLIRLDDPEDPLLKTVAAGDRPLRLVSVGTYQAGEIGASCYHNNLAALEMILSHLVDGDGVLVADMVAGTDAFAGTLHSQFDLLALVVEPTWRGVEVFRQYHELATAAGMGGRLLVIGNKIQGSADLEFLMARLPEECIVGCLGFSSYLRAVEQGDGRLNMDGLEPENLKVLEEVWRRLSVTPSGAQERYGRLLELHRAYVSQPFIRDRFGDLSDQIDPGFVFPV